MTKVSQLLDDNSIEYKEKGADYLVRCLNPEHNDQTPSLRIDKVSGIFHCWSCGFRGNVFTFYGAERPLIDIKKQSLLNKIRKLNQISTPLELPKDALPFARDHRGISSEVYTSNEAFETSIVPELENRIVFPIRGLDGRILNFVGRRTHSSAPPKYIMYPSKEVYVYPQKIVRNRLILVEGLFDRLNLLTYPIDASLHVVFGTKTITAKTVTRMFSPLIIQGVTEIVTLFDGDQAGREATETVKVLIEKTFSIPVTSIHLPNDVDPGSMTVEDVKKYLSRYLIK